jgi:hypothetical protein
MLLFSFYLDKLYINRYTSLSACKAVFYKKIFEFTLVTKVDFTITNSKVVQRVRFLN